MTGNIPPAIDLRDPSLPAGTVIAHLGLAPHPEGGFYRETWRAAVSGSGKREDGTAILFLLAAGQRSHWHRVDASELWLWQGGAPLHLYLSEDGASTTRLRIGPDLSVKAKRFRGWSGRMYGRRRKVSETGLWSVAS